MISKIPIIGSPLGCRDIAYALSHMLGKDALDDFSVGMAGFIQKKHVYFVNSGISAFYIILKILQENSNKSQVVLPAYTAGSLVTAVLKAGLKPVLCDIRFKDFNSDIVALPRVVSSDTLAVVCVHMFGIGIPEIVELRQKLPPDVFLIEDCAQSMGSKIDKRQLGGFGDISFFSFNRGKNLPTYKGGCIATDSENLSGRLSRYIELLPRQGVFSQCLLPFKTMAISLAVKPFVYGLCYGLISQFKENSPPGDILLGEFTNFQASLGISLLGAMEGLFKKRYLHGQMILQRLKDRPGIIVPQIPINSEPAFNRLPVVFEDIKRKEDVEEKLWHAGIETSRMYLKPLHYIFDLGYKSEDFPNAVYFARHLVTLPVHPSVEEKDLNRMVEIIESSR